MEEKLKTAIKSAIRAWHLLLFELVGDRENRKWHKEFRGFDFVDVSTEYQEKVCEIKTWRMAGDATSVRNILVINFEGTKEEPIECICSSLMDISSLSNEDHEDDEDHEHDEDDQSGN